MGKLIIGLIIGLVVGAGGALTFGGGAMMGAGVATGLSAGMCSTIKSAQNAGLMTTEQADQVMAGAAEVLVGVLDSEDDDVAGSAAACDQVLAKLKEAAG